MAHPTRNDFLQRIIRLNAMSTSNDKTFEN